MLELGLKVLLGYLLGSLNGSLLLGRVLGGPDVRTVGSGNAGGTNALRARGKWFALGAVLIDVGKGYLAAAWVPGLDLPGAPTDPAVARDWLSIACAGAAIAGHCYPVWFGFAGGKGGATTVGAVAALAPGLLIPAMLTWIVVVVATGFVGLATMLGAVALPLTVLVGGVGERIAMFVGLTLIAGFVVFMHRGNIARMRRGEEDRMTGLMLGRRPR